MKGPPAANPNWLDRFGRGRSDSRWQTKQIVVAAPVQGRREDLLCVDHLAELRALRLNLNRVCFDGHRLPDSPRLKRNVFPKLVIDLERNVGCDELLKTRGSSCEPVRSRRQGQQSILAV